jgi:hypothetical protein
VVNRPVDLPTKTVAMGLPTLGQQVHSALVVLPI